MIKTKYEDYSIDNEILSCNLTRITKQIYKILCDREEDKDWKKPLNTLIIELTGLSELIVDQINFLTLISKLEGLYSLEKEEDFFSYRSTILECLKLMNKISFSCQQ